MNNKMILTHFLPKKPTLFLIVFFLLSPSAYSNNSVPATVTYCFTPGGNCTEEIIDIINHTEKTLWIQAYQFTSQSISNAVIDAKQKRDVDVRIILDKTQCREHPKPDDPVIACSQAGIPIWVDHKPTISHNKVMIADNCEVISGSFNFSEAAQKHNAENVLIIQSPELANAYAANWKNRQAVSVTLKDYIDYITLKNIPHKHAGKKHSKNRKSSYIVKAIDSLVKSVP